MKQQITAIKQHFKEFLQKEGAYEIFCDQLKTDPTCKGFDHHCNGVEFMSMAVSSAFWTTEEMGRYWKEIDIKWNSQLNIIENEI